ncbi:MAG: SIS domain-containing protein [Chloroflexi bacterium]|nr:SIS domain-containing protein [Chloroflexota bacterium]
MHPILTDLERRYPDLADCLNDIETAFGLMRGTYETGGKVLICGNGGSAADSDHWVGELMKGFERQRPISYELRQQLARLDSENGAYIADHLQGALPTIALTGHIALGTAFSNDVAGDMVFAQQVYGLGKAGDTLIGISTSGNSTNVLHALAVAKVLGLHSIGLTGKTGGKMPALCDVTIRVPYERTLEIQERHLPVYHALSIMLEQEFFHE